MGHSKSHAANVGLIRNIGTGKISSQFHVVYDKHFTTLPVNKIINTETIPSEWTNLFRSNRERTIDLDDYSNGTKVHHPITTPTGIVNSQPLSGTIPSSKPYKDLSPQKDVSFDPDNTTITPPISPIQRPNPSHESNTSPLVQPQTNRSSSPIPQHLIPTHTKRVSKPIVRLDPSSHYVSQHFPEEYINFLQDFHVLNIHNAFLVDSDLNRKSTPLTVSYDILHLMKLDNDDDTIIHGQHPLAFSARANANDDPTFKEAMSGPDREGFLEAMHKEIESLESMKSWIIVPREKALNESRSIISTTWVFKRKRYPDGSVKKLKARFVV